MKLSQLVYLLLFFAPVAFLLGFIAGAPRPVEQKVVYEKIDTRTLPVSPIDLARHESSMVVQDTPVLQRNDQVAR